MKLQQFLQQRTTPEIWHVQPVIWLRGPEYPILFCSSLIQQLKKTDIRVESVDLESQDLAYVIAKLEMSFLGMRTLYWLRDCAGLSPSARKNLLTYLESYTGPNGVLIFATTDSTIQPKTGMAVELDAVVSQSLFVTLAQLEFPSVAKNKAAIAAIYARNIPLSLDTSYMLLRYLSLVGAGYQEFIKEWLSTLMAPETTLFTLSTHFFAKDGTKFFGAWAQARADYGEPFWLVFWSEQLWRAAHYIKLMERKELAEAKKIAFRLPFSFIQRDWKKSSVNELIAAHDFIYSADGTIKNSGSNTVLDLFYTKFMQGIFKQA